VLVCPRAGRKVCDASTASDGGGSGEMSWSGTADHFNVVLFLGERVSDDERDAFAAYLASMSVVTHAFAGEPDWSRSFPNPPRWRRST